MELSNVNGGKSFGEAICKHCRRGRILGVEDIALDQLADVVEPYVNLF